MESRIHYGSLELQGIGRPDPNIPMSYAGGGQEPETLPLSGSFLRSQEKDAKVLQDLEIRKKGRQLAIPTDDKLVQLRLRELGEPIILFGEQAPERRERLRTVMVRKGVTEAMPSSVAAGDYAPYRYQDEIFYTEGPPALKAARAAITRESLAKARDRLDRARSGQKDEDEVTAGKIAAVMSGLDGIVNVSSQVGDERPLSSCNFSHDSKRLLTASWSGACRLWNVEDCSLVQTFKGHTDRCVSLQYHPSKDLSPSVCNFASAGADCNVILWALDRTTPLQVLQGHEHRVNRVAFHPSGRYLGSTSHDLTWRLWDVETGETLLEQEGHARAVIAIGFQHDGALAATAGTDNIGRAWDLRSGKAIYTMRGHSKQILHLDWSPNGYHMATCSEDNTVKIWDLRKRRNLYTIPAHSSLVSQVKFIADGSLIFTSSFDNTCKFWNGKDFSPVKTIATNEGKTMCADVSPDFKSIATVSYDRTWKIFAQDELRF